MWRCCLLVLALAVAPLPGLSESYLSVQERRPDLFDPRTGLRVGRQRAPTPEDIPPPARRVDAAQVAQAISRGALALDVFGATRSRYDELDGTWLVSTRRMSLPGAIWLPEVGRGQLADEMQRYLFDTVAQYVPGPADRAIVVFCIADCWMSWNAAQRLATAGYAEVLWFREGTDGWAEAGLPLAPLDPVPVPVD